MSTLVVIDLQDVFADADSPWFVPRFAEVVDPIRRLVAAFDPDVIFTRFVAPAEPTGAWRDYYDRWPFARQPADSPIYQVIAPFADRPTVDVTTFGKWDVLAERIDGELVVAGVSTDCCVLSTVLPAADAGVPVRVVRDACAGATDESHAQTLAVLELYAPLVTLSTTADAIAQRQAS